MSGGQVKDKCMSTCKVRGHELPSVLSFHSVFLPSASCDRDPAVDIKSVCTCEDGAPGGSGSRMALFGLPSQPLTNCVMRGRLLNLSVPQFPPLNMEIFIVATSVGCGKDSVRVLL